MSYIERHRLFLEEMYGGRKGKSVHDALISQSLILTFQGKVKKVFYVSTLIQRNVMTEFICLSLQYH